MLLIETSAKINCASGALELPDGTQVLYSLDAFRATVARFHYALEPSAYEIEAGFTKSIDGQRDGFWHWPYSCSSAAHHL